MSHPDLIASHLDDEEAVATVDLSGEDILVITPTRSLLYESEGILSDESVSEFPHDVDGVAVKDGRRGSRIELTYPIQEPKQLRVPSDRRDAAIHYMLAGIFHAKGITESGESVQSVYLFNEMTLVITSQQVLTHIGAMVWDADYETYPFEDLTRLAFEEGSVATEVVLYVSGRSQRIKVPKGRGEEVKRALQEAVFAHFDVTSLDELNDALDDGETGQSESSTDGLLFDEAVSPLGSRDAADGRTDDANQSTGDTSDIDRKAIEPILADLQEQLAQQQDTLDAQEQALDELIELLSED